MHFKIVVPLYNVEKWITACLRSVQLQKYDNWQCVVVDDISTDNTAAKIRKKIEGEPRFTFVENVEKAFALKNIYDAIELSNPDPEDVIVTLDGDDWFANDSVLNILKEEYEQTNCLITYGSYAEYPSGIKGKFAHQIPSHVIKNKSFRTSPWCSSHLRTFKYKLWSKIKREDLIGQDGKFYQMAWDLAFMFPMLEMAKDRSQYIEEVLYIYNTSNPLNDHKVNHELQLQIEQEIRAKDPYSAIEEWGDNC